MTDFSELFLSIAGIAVLVLIADNERRRRRIARDARAWLRIVQPASGEWRAR